MTAKTEAQTAAPALAALFDEWRARFARWSEAMERDDGSKDSDNEVERLCDAAGEVFDEIMNAPCADDDELLAKLRFLVEAEYKILGQAPTRECDWDSIAVAAFGHFKPKAAQLTERQASGPAAARPSSARHGEPAKIRVSIKTLPRRETESYGLGVEAALGRIGAPERASDPIFAALAAYRIARGRTRDSFEAMRRAEQSYDPLGIEVDVYFDFEPFRSVAELDERFARDPRLEASGVYGAWISRAGFGIPLDVEAGEPEKVMAFREKEYHRARAALVAIEEAKKRASDECGLAKAEEACGDAVEAERARFNDLLACAPTTPAGAATLLRFLSWAKRANELDLDDDSLEAVDAALASVADFLDRAA